jgi:hypothetical protein
MKGQDVMPDTSGLSEAKHALLEKYLRGDIPRAAKAAGDGSQHAKAEVADPRARVVEVRVGGSKRPFFFLHGHWQGTPFFCFSLARELGSDQPFYALEPYQFDGLWVPPTVEMMAAAHLLSLRAVQPEGPYFLGGECNGGLVAYEMARQLHAAGQTVALLVLMDPMYLGYRSQRKLLRGIISRLGDLVGLGPDKQLDWFLRLLYVCKLLYRSLQLMTDGLISLAPRKAMPSIKRFTRMLGLAHGRDQGRFALPRLDSLITTEALSPKYLGIFEWIDMGYKPPSLYPGKITFFWPSENPWQTVSWRKVIEAKEAQEVEVYVVPGNQETWKTEHFHVLAERLRLCLSKAQKEAI